MLYAIVIRRDRSDLIDRFDLGLTVSPLKGDFLAIVSSDEQLRLELTELTIDTGIQSPVRAYMHLEHTEEALLPTMYRGEEVVDNAVANRELLAFKSRLSFLTSELFGVSDFYSKLDTSVNSVGTRREFRYRIMMNEFPCYIFEQDKSLLEQLSEIGSWSLGPLIASTRSLTTFDYDPPSWYIRGVFKDWCLRQERGQLIQGPTTGELYLFDDEPVNLFIDLQTEVTEIIRGEITSSLETGLFPTETPAWSAKTKGLKRLESGQWIYEGEVTKALYSDSPELSFLVDDVDRLLSLVTYISFSPQFERILSRLQIRTEGTRVRVTMTTPWLSDLLSVSEARRAENVGPGRLSTTEPGFRLFDSELSSYLFLS